MDEHQQAPESHDPYGGEAAQEYTRPQKGSRRTLMIAGAIAVVVLALGGFFGVKALAGGGSSSTSTAGQTPVNGNGRGNGGRRGTIGTLQSIDGSTLTVATFERGGNDNNAAGGTTTVITNGSTKFYKTVSGSLGDIKVGDRVTAMGTPVGTNAVTAARITDTGTMRNDGGPGGGGARRFGAGAGNGGPPPSQPNATRPDPNGFANGTVKSISGSTFTVTDNDGATKTVNTTGSTAVSVLKAVAINDLATGQPVTVRGKTNSDGTVTASDVVQGEFGRRFGGGQPPGTGSTTR